MKSFDAHFVVRNDEVLYGTEGGNIQGSFGDIYPYVGVRPVVALK